MAYCKIRVSAIGPISRALGKKEFELRIHANQRLREILEQIGITGEDILNVYILVNGQPIESLDNVDTKLLNGDKVTIISPVSGG